MPKRDATWRWWWDVNRKILPVLPMGFNLQGRKRKLTLQSPLRCSRKFISPEVQSQPFCSRSQTSWPQCSTHMIFSCFCFKTLNETRPNGYRHSVCVKGAFSGRNTDRVCWQSALSTDASCISKTALLSAQLISVHLSNRNYTGEYTFMCP